MRRYLFIAIMIACCLTAGVVHAASITISYLSADHVYLNGGREEGLAIGQQLTITKAGKLIATLEVVYIADHSASCTIVESTEALKVGDEIDVPAPIPSDTVVLAPTATDTVVAPPKSSATTPKDTFKHSSPSPDLWGSFAVGLLGWRDKDASDRDYTQSNVRLNLRTRHLMNDRLTLAIRSRGRYDERNRNYRSTADSRVWLNRLYEFSLLYQSSDERWRVTIGRAPIRSVAALGVLDGMVVERNLSESWSVGAFGGLQPQWQYSEGRASLSRFGFMGEYRQVYGNVTWKSSAALLREYHKAEISRDALMLQSNVYNRDKWQASLLTEMDYNSGWRKERAGTSLALSSVYAYLRYQFIKGLSMNVNYGSRKTVWVWDYYALADSLLDDQTRRWVRVGADIMPGSRWAIGGTVGSYFQDADSRRQLSTNVYGRVNRIWDPRSSFWAQYSTSESASENAHTVSFRITQGFRQLDQFSVAFGRNSYQVTGADSRASWWTEGELQNELVDRVMLRLRYRYAAGDDLRGNQFETELGYRF